MPIHQGVMVRCRGCDGSYTLLTDEEIQSLQEYLRVRLGAEQRVELVPGATLSTRGCHRCHKDPGDMVSLTRPRAVGGES